MKIIVFSAISYGLSATLVSIESDMATTLVVGARFLGAFLFTAIGSQTPLHCSTILDDFITGPVEVWSILLGLGLSSSASGWWLLYKKSYEQVIQIN